MLVTVIIQFFEVDNTDELIQLLGYYFIFWALISQVDSFENTL